VSARCPKSPSCPNHAEHWPRKYGHNNGVRAGQQAMFTCAAGRSQGTMHPCQFSAGGQVGEFLHGASLLPFHICDITNKMFHIGVIRPFQLARGGSHHHWPHRAARPAARPTGHAAARQLGVTLDGAQTSYLAFMVVLGLVSRWPMTPIHKAARAGPQGDWLRAWRSAAFESRAVRACAVLAARAIIPPPARAR